MTRTAPLTRRGLLSSTAGLALGALPSARLAAQALPVAAVEFAAGCRAITGFDPLPRQTVARLMDALSEADRQRVARAATPGEALTDGALRRRVLHALYRGVLPDATGDGVTRIGYAEALMFATVEDTLNVPSFCGGLPAYWAQPPGSET